MNSGGRFHAFVNSSDLLAGDLPVESQTLRARAQRDGYLYFPGLIPEQLVTDLRRLALQQAAEAGWLDEDGSAGIARPTQQRLRFDDPGYVAWLQRLVPSPEFRALGDFSGIRRILQVLFDGPVQSRCGDLCRIFFPGSSEPTTLPHQDEFYVKSDSQLWTAWIPLGACPMTLGPLAVIPGSHLGGVQPHDCSDGECQGVAVAPEAGWACNDYAPGDLLLFNKLTIHGGCANTSDRQVRLSADYRYRPLPSASKKPVG